MADRRLGKQILEGFAVNAVLRKHLPCLIDRLAKLTVFEKIGSEIGTQLSRQCLVTVKQTQAQPTAFQPTEIASLQNRLGECERALDGVGIGDVHRLAPLRRVDRLVKCGNKLFQCALLFCHRTDHRNTKTL